MLSYVGLFISCLAFGYAMTSSYAVVRRQRRERRAWARATAQTSCALMGGLQAAQHDKLSMQTEQALMELGHHTVQMCMTTTGLDLAELLDIQGEARGKGSSRGADTGKSG